MPESWTATAGGRDISLSEIEGVTHELIAGNAARTIWLFYGEMGSGKTTLIKAIGRNLGVSETMSSPTFSIVNEYAGATGKRIYHFDLYRLKDEKEIYEIGMEEYFDSQNLCMVEWPEKLGSMMPPLHVKIRLTVSDPLHRKIDFQLV